MEAAIFKTPIEVANQLAENGTSLDHMLIVVDAMITAKNECTDNDPAGSRGWRSWQMGTRRNREVHVGIGDWEKDDTGQVPSIVSKKFGRRIVICNTDDGTCKEAFDPQNSSRKGASTDRDVHANQINMFNDESTGKVVSLNRVFTSAGPVVTYYLCVYSEGDDVRAELSCPNNFENGFFTGFLERIFILGGDTPKGGDALKPLQEGESEYEINVTLKKPH